MHKVVVFALLVTFCDSAHLPPTFKKCKKSEPDFNQCLSNAVDNAVLQLNEPKNEVGIPNLEPLDIPSLTIEAGSSAVQFEQNFKNLKIVGLTQPSDMKVNMDFDKNVLTLDVTYPQIRLNFEYEINGKIMILPISGKGPGVITLDQPHFVLSYSLEKYDKHGKTHFKVSKTDLAIEPKRVHFQLDNLFNGDKNLGDNVNQVMNDNWKEVFADVKASYENAFGQIFESIFNNLLERITASDLFEE